MINSDPKNQLHYENLLADYLDLSASGYLNPTRKALEHMRNNENHNELYDFEEQLKFFQDVFSQSYELSHQKSHGKKFYSNLKNRGR